MKLPALLLLVCAVALAAAETPSRPNIVWIVGEDLGPELGCYGDTNAITPNIDRLAREGVRFTRAFTLRRKVERDPAPLLQHDETRRGTL